jgi:hypothetical protein
VSLHIFCKISGAIFWHGLGWLEHWKSTPRLIMNKNDLAFWMTLTGTVCWGVCFLWMHRISIRQNSFLDQLREQGRRIEKLSKAEHDLIKEVHPKVGEIKEGMEEMTAVVKENSETLSTESKKRRLNSSSKSQ